MELQSGFGRTGTVDWQTTILKQLLLQQSEMVKGYFCNTTSSGAFTVNLPAGTAGDIVFLQIMQELLIQII